MVVVVVVVVVVASTAVWVLVATANSVVFAQRASAMALLSTAPLA
jgi:hypothetical protein